MATKLQLQGAFGSLLDSMSRRFDPFWPTHVVERWLAVTGQAAAIADPALWNALPSESPAYDAPVADLNRVTNDLVAASETGRPEAMLPVLDDLEALLANLDGFLRG